MMKADNIYRQLQRLLATFVMLTALSAGWGFCQQAAPGQFNISTEEHQETYTVFTDRNLYIVGEKILFTIFNLSDKALKETGWSKVIYIELVSSENEPVIQEKFKIQGEGKNGYLEIPLSILSGTYYLRGYTRWMKNMPAEKYAYARVKIVNPYQPDISTVSQQSPAEQYQRLTGPGHPDGNMSIDIMPDKQVYGKRTKVQMSISVQGVELEDLSGLCLTVVREAAMDTSSFLEYHKDDPASGLNGTEIFIPETRGMAVTGEVIDKVEHRPTPNTRVQLSVIGEDPDYFGYLTGEDGRFYISIPDYEGLKDFYISAESEGSNEIEILIDKDFSTDFVDFKTLPFQLSEEERTVAEEMMMNIQVRNAYLHDLHSVDSATEDREKQNFYSRPFETFKTDDYVKLPSVEEFIYEVIPQVTVIRTAGKKELKVFGDYSDLSIYKPLVLLDHVAISDLSSILAVSPEKIDRIDVINAPYIRGSINYGGIISIFSKKHDLAGVDLPGYSYFFGLKTLAIQKEISFPWYDNDKGDSRQPDFRNCLIWIPDLGLDEHGSASAAFYTADKKGAYLIYLRGVSPDGRVVSGGSKIYVE